MMKILIIICIAIVWLIAISTYNYVKMERCLKKHQAEWDNRKKVAMELIPDITQDELMGLYLDYCKELGYRYMPRF